MKSCLKKQRVSAKSGSEVEISNTYSINDCILEESESKTSLNVQWADEFGLKLREVKEFEVERTMKGTKLYRQNRLDEKKIKLVSEVSSKNVIFLKLYYKAFIY